jgi:hypothetical protein
MEAKAIQRIAKTRLVVFHEARQRSFDGQIAIRTDAAERAAKRICIFT